MSINSVLTIDPNGILTRATVQVMKDSLERNDTVFTSHGCNGQTIPFQARVNNGPVMPPQRERGTATSIFSRTAEANSGLVQLTVEYLNLSFNVKKSSGRFRLVTAFSERARTASRKHP